MLNVNFFTFISVSSVAKSYPLLLTAGGFSSQLKTQHSTLRTAIPIILIGIARGAHGVLDKNKKFAKNFISLIFNHLSQKISCGQGTIFARRAHFRAKGRESMFFRSMAVSAMFPSQLFKKLICGWHGQKGVTATVAMVFVLAIGVLVI